MNEKDFHDLLTEIDLMSIEEYNRFHKEVLKMKAKSRTNLKGDIRMTDEEMAEKYVKNRYGTLCVGGANALQDAFLAGLKAGRPK